VPIKPLTLTAALRYESNDAELDFLENNITFADGTVFPNFRVENIESDSDALLPRLAVEYKLTPDILTYASITAGYRPAGVNFAADDDVEEVLSFGRERSINYELGFKSSWYNNLLIFNAAVFHNDVDDFQVVIFDQFLQADSIDNADAAITGAEFELKATPVKGFDIMAGFGLVDTDFTDFTNSITGEDFSDNNLLFTPGYTFNIAAQYRTSSGIVSRLEMVGSGAVFFNEENTLSSEPGFGFGDFGSVGAPATFGLQVKAEF